MALFSKPIVKYDMIQLDSRIVRNSLTGNLKAEYPSILLGEYYPELTAYENYSKAVSDGATDLFSFIKRYDTDVIQNLSDFITLCEENPNVEREFKHNFIFHGYYPYFIDDNGIMQTVPGVGTQQRLTLSFYLHHSAENRNSFYLNVSNEDEGLYGTRFYSEFNVKKGDVSQKNIYNNDSTSFREMGLLDGRFKIYILATPYDYDYLGITNVYLLWTKPDVNISAQRAVQAYVDEWNSFFESPTWGELLYQFSQKRGKNYNPDDFYIGETEIGGVNKFSQVPIPSADGLPNINNSGLIHMYSLTTSDMSDLAKCLWQDDFVTNILKLFGNPMESIVTLSLLPFFPELGSNLVPVIVGNRILQYIDSGVLTQFKLNAVEKQYYDIEFGEIQFIPYWKNFVDLKMRTTIYLPFIGYREIDSKHLVYGSILHLKYLVDILSGTASAVLYCTSFTADKTANIIGQWSGNIIQSIPLSGANYSQNYLSIINSGISGASALATGNVLGAVNSVLSAASNLSPSIDKVSNLNANAGFLSIRRAYILMEIPEDVTAKNLNEVSGNLFKNNIDYNRLSGFTKMEEFHAENITYASDSEKAEIERLFKEGVIL